ncbi:sulfatase [Rhodopirellula sp. SWK7]|uniref:sulfatase family protein n=1 Tax=Rhodopirellula sp. SWK7 TaxID=595460 RepID=UPI0002C0139D|nr:sulfatase-like hydrolase/transferase [Rhodopirellula sp. SWK7]EMI43779.1 N-acetylgalactosamine 6-sulfate sulfatase (GALNS) [Rhodopirellula sp. SWK7]
MPKILDIDEIGNERMATMKKTNYCIFLLCASAAISHTQAAKPNVIVLLADDLGYADVGFQNYPASADVHTPNIDKLAKSGIIFKNGYVPVATCGPSRGSLLTGRNSARWGQEDNGNLPSNSGPPEREILIPRALPNDYVTAMFGKWHIGKRKGNKVDLSPKGRGFDEAWDCPASYFSSPECIAAAYKNSTVPEEPYYDPAIGNLAADFIARNIDKPFFLYAGFKAPHSPFETWESYLRRVVEARPQWQEVFERLKKRPDYQNKYTFEKITLETDKEILRLVYLAMILGMDDAIGHIVQTLEEHDLRENTLIFFLSDNGGSLSGGASHPNRPIDLGSINKPLRSGKGTVLDGGVRVPFVMSWPGVLPSNTLDDTTVVSSMDIFTTTVNLAGAQVPGDRIIDGVNLMPYLKGDKTGQPHSHLLFRRTDRDAYAIRSGNFKYTFDKRRKIDELYDIQNNLGEDEGLSAQNPEKFESMKELYRKEAASIPDPVRFKTDEELAAWLEANPLTPQPGR